MTTDTRRKTSPKILERWRWFADEPQVKKIDGRVIHWIEVVTPRILESNGDIQPAEVEANYYSTLETEAEAA